MFSLRNFRFVHRKNMYFLPLQSFSALNAPALCAQTVGPRSKVKVSLESLVNGLSCPQSGRMGSDDSFWSQIDKM